MGRLTSGLCKISIKRVNENVPRDVYCTLQEEFVPSEKSKMHRNRDSVSDIKKNGYVLVWAVDKTLGSGESKQSGWLKIKMDQVLNYDFIDRIPVN